MSTSCSVALRGRQFLTVNSIRVITATLAGLLADAPANAQQASDDEVIEEIVVQGGRAVISMQ